MDREKEGKMCVRADLTECTGALPSGEAHVWHADFGTAQNRLDSLYNLLDHEEQERAWRFRVPAPREQFVISHAFLRLALSKYLQIGARDVRFRVSEYGKPELTNNSEVRFNLSHTDGAAVLAITCNRAVGVDVERVREDVEAVELAQRFFSAAEVDWLRSQPASARVAFFFACWTAKEAYIKACGTGLSMPLDGFSVIPRAGHERLQLEIYGDPGLSKTWSIWQLDLEPSLRCALAVQDVNVTVRFGKWLWPQTIL
ncbi:MAG TPA: 4'-phosphopantetheinyl transferase superfamily protein [Terriglobales bacterium]|nr:4'-phosphopantetheinyl transferase superfamily protein [Terriglobales bacterium]